MTLHCWLNPQVQEQSVAQQPAPLLEEGIKRGQCVGLGKEAQEVGDQQVACLM